MNRGPSLRLAQTLLGAGAVCPSCKQQIRRFQARKLRRGRYYHAGCGRSGRRTV